MKRKRVKNIGNKISVSVKNRYDKIKELTLKQLVIYGVGFFILMILTALTLGNALTGVICFKIAKKRKRVSTIIPSGKIDKNRRSVIKK